MNETRAIYADEVKITSCESKPVEELRSQIQHCLDSKDIVIKAQYNNRARLWYIAGREPCVDPQTEEDYSEWALAIQYELPSLDKKYCWSPTAILRDEEGDEVGLVSFAFKHNIPEPTHVIVEDKRDDTGYAIVRPLGEFRAIRIPDKDPEFREFCIDKGIDYLGGEPNSRRGYLRDAQTFIRGCNAIIYDDTAARTVGYIDWDREPMVVDTPKVEPVRDYTQGASNPIPNKAYPTMTLTEEQGQQYLKQFYANFRYAEYMKEAKEWKLHFFGRRSTLEIFEGMLGDSIDDDKLHIHCYMDRLPSSPHSNLKWLPTQDSEYVGMQHRLSNSHIYSKYVLASKGNK